MHVYISIWYAGFAFFPHLVIASGGANAKKSALELTAGAPHMFHVQPLAISDATKAPPAPNSDSFAFQLGKLDGVRRTLSSSSIVREAKLSLNKT